MSGRIIEEDLFTKYSILDSRSIAGQRIHDFLAARAKVLAGKYIDFDKTPATFVLSDADEPNAFYTPAPNYDPDQRPQRSDYQTVRIIKNPLDTPIICVTRGLTKMVDNMDQLDFVLGHELTHMIMRQYGIKNNSKGEEEIADLHAVDVMYDAGADPKQALLISEKINAYAEAQRKRKPKQYNAGGGKTEGINWSEIFDVHMTHGNRKAGIEASLTRLSHLIDERLPTDIDKSVFAPRYSDPVDDFLKANNYATKKPLGKLKILIDCIDYLAAPFSAQDFFQTELDTLLKENPRDPFGKIERQRDAIQERINAGYTDYFHGPVIDKKYQQKIAGLAEAVISGIEKNKSSKARARRFAMNVEDLNIYLQDKAYRHISAHGYPNANDMNYLSASGILYSYFYCLLKNHSPDTSSRNGNKPAKQAQIEIDLHKIEEKICTANTAEIFNGSVDEFHRLSHILREIRTIDGADNQRGKKLDNLSDINDSHAYGFIGRPYVYADPQIGGAVPWNNLADIADEDEKTKERVVQFLRQNSIEDFRITHNLPYITAGYSDCYALAGDGKTIARKIPQYELDFAIHRSVILQAYDYIKAYFSHEDVFIEEKCTQALNIDDSDFESFETTKDSFNGSTLAYRKIYDFVSVFNALPEDQRSGEQHNRKTVLTLIPERYRADCPVPGSKEVSSGWKKRVVFEFSEDLLSFDNPIFREYFGADFKRNLAAQKKAQQQRMFNTTLALLNRFVDIQADTQPKLDDLNKKSADLLNQILEAEDAEFMSEKWAERHDLDKQIRFYKAKKDQAESFIYNFLSSIFSGEKNWYQLQRLKPEQKSALAEFAVRDRKGVILEICHAERYEHFCDYLGILEDQVTRVISGNFEFTELMQIVAERYRYQRAMTKDDLKAFVNEHGGHKYSRDHQKYAWYMHIFDAMRHLQGTSEIDVRSLAMAFSEIEQREKSSNGLECPLVVAARYQTYRKFITQSNVIALVSRAVCDQRNYQGLSSGELLETADALIGMHNAIREIFAEKWDDDAHSNVKKKPQEPSEQGKFLDLVDENILNVLREAEYQALQTKNALEKIIALYHVYNQGGGRYKSENDRSVYLKTLIKKEGRLQRISALSQDSDFWPDDVLEHVKAFAFAKNTFLDDKDFEDRLLNDILKKLEAQPSGKKKNACLFILLDKNLRAAYPKTRDRLFEIYSNDIAAKLGLDDGSEAYQKRLAFYLGALSSENKKDWDVIKNHGWGKEGILANVMSSADKYALMRRLSDTIISQEKTSQMIKESYQIKLNSNDMLKSYLYGIGVDYLAEDMDRDVVTAQRFIEFFNSKGEQCDCEDMSTFIKVSMRKKYSQFNERIDSILENTRPTNCKILYENFWSAPLEVRAVIIARMLKSAVNTTEEKINQVQHSWEKVFDLVMNTLIRIDDTSVEAKYARDIMHSYIKSRSDYERELIMSAMMVANKNIGNDNGNIGKALKLFLENMGPAEIKLGQAIASHPDTPETIRVELQKLKSSADIPARWTLYEWIRAENIPEEFWKDAYVGEILGSASYYTSVALGDDKVLRILRSEAREKADKGFRVIRSTVEDLKEKEASSDLSYNELTSSVQEMVVQAAKMSEIETDHDAGQRQYEHAKDIYNGVTISSGAQSFMLSVMDWRARGQNWIIMDRAMGVTFNALPDTTQEHIAYKRHFAKAYIVFEIINILSGNKFDHDRHGAQLSIDSESGSVGIYDTGAMALHAPPSHDQKILGNVIYDVIKATLSGGEIMVSFNHAIGEKINSLYQQGMDTQYLIEVKKALLALGDFFKILNAEDIKDILLSINLSAHISKDIQQGVTEKMSMFEEAQYQAFLDLQSAQEARPVKIFKENHGQATSPNVVTIRQESRKKDKAKWLQAAFQHPCVDGDLSGRVSNDTTDFIVTFDQSKQHGRDLECVRA